MRSVLLLCFYICLGNLLTSCSTRHYRELKWSSRQDFVVDTANVAIIPFDQKTDWVFDSTYKSATLSNEEIQLLERALKACAVSYNKLLQKDKRPWFGIDFGKHQYKRQYIAAENDKGEKVVWVNGFCHIRDDRWKSQIVETMDGGNCYFSVKINLTRMECFDVRVNGYGREDGYSGYFLGIK